MKLKLYDNKNNREATSANRVYLVTVLRTFAQIQPNGWTSDMLETLVAVE